MRLVLQRVEKALVCVAGRTVGEIGTGLLVLAGFGSGDGPSLPEGKAWPALCGKVLDLRIFPDDQDKLNLSLRDIKGDLLLVSQFTLYADCRKGRRPSFTDAAPPELARALYDRFVADMRALAPGRCEQGVFGEIMELDFVNWGPVTILLDSKDFAASGA